MTLPSSPPSPHAQAIEKAAEEIATAWFVRLNDPASGAADRADFEAWLAADPAHRRAYAAVERLWRRLDAPARDLGAGGWYRAAPPACFAGRLRPALALAASLVLLVGALWWRDPGVLDRALADQAAAPGQARTIDLADGSRVYLDGDSALSVTMRGGERRVTLARGRAWFDVTPDEHRPFTVTAGGVETRVLGTAFAVERDERAVRVTVERGRVSVSNGMDGAPVELGPGHRVTMRAGGGQARPMALDAEAALAWRRGLIVFDRASLADVVAELDRRMAGRVLLADDDLRRLTLSGVFRADEPDMLLGALRSGLGLRTTRLPGFAVLIRR